ncbi:type I phosphomannose isomerase catalytic subunit [Mesoflavibacter sp. CH_XMU1404-2]|uniref:type I phosphomannose isomerase catalytic subunit n=1 Tax=Mesoflavibacter sp. CH_XMU1404-2 TaxID=3107766 RepID=UPI00300A55A5
MLTPLKFQPLFKYRIWGGNKLKTVLNKDYNGDSIGESWEISDVPNDETIVEDGSFKGYTLKQLIQEFKGEFVGESVYKQFGEAFPLLIKFIDAKTPLSIQVHPNNEYAKTHHNSFGKNEMWYIMQADEDANIIVGFEKEIDKTQFKQHLEDKTLLEVMHHENVKKGDAFYIPTGRIHAIGAGVMLAEIQQTSDVTYRVYDYDRVDKTIGKTRELHTEQATEVLDFNVEERYKTDYKTETNTSNTLIHSPYFKTNFLPVNGELVKDYSSTDSFVIYMCVSGQATIQHQQKDCALNTGETILLPASIKEVMLKSEDAQILEVYF